MRWLQGCGISGKEEGIFCSGIQPSFCCLSQGLLYFLCEQVSMILGLCQPRWSTATAYRLGNLFCTLFSSYAHGERRYSDPVSPGWDICAVQVERDCCAFLVMYSAVVLLLCLTFSLAICCLGCCVPHFLLCSTLGVFL